MLSLGFHLRPDFVLIHIAGRLPEHRVHPQGWRGWLQRRFNPPRESLQVWRERLQLLADDPQVKGIIITIGDLQAGLPAIESLRRSLLAFRTSGKRLIAFLVTANLYTYYLASAADTLMAPESAELALHGLRTEATFLRAALDQLDIRPQFHHIAEYKSAANRLLYASMPEPQREMQTSLLESTFEEVLAAPSLTPAGSLSRPSGRPSIRDCSRPRRHMRATYWTPSRTTMNSPRR